LGDPAVRKVSVLPWTTTRQYLLGFALRLLPLTVATAEGKDVEGEAKSVHINFPTGRDDGQQTSNHIIVDASGFGEKFKEFDKSCTSPN
jgi:hypothetical protein